MPNKNINEFQIHFNENEIRELHKRIDLTRLPQNSDIASTLGIDRNYLLSLLKYWKTDYDWLSREQELNKYPQYICKINDLNIHFFHIRSQRKKAPSLLLIHGWPDSFLRYAKIFSLLPNYNLIIPSLPGFAFSTLPKKGFSNNSETAEIFHKLMTDILGYKEYLVSGGDMGRGVACYLAAKYPESIKGLHITDVGLAKEIMLSDDAHLTKAELNYKYKAKEWLQKEAGYINIQSTKPQTLAYLLSDSPAGMAAWITEKYRSWSEFSLLTMDDICDSLTLYWLTNTAATSVRTYYGNTFTLPLLDKIIVPTAMAAFPYDVLAVPRSWIEKNYPIVMYQEMPHGGHFTALEQPKAFAENISQFIDTIIK